ncbi:hypothetical protein HDU76_005301 [Blyttiomyces sp. JEL0837]|nr:hypothetical protein HDU76_005301 [Blyttiomyces sp. JEL0837]
MSTSGSPPPPASEKEEGSNPPTIDEEIPTTTTPEQIEGIAAITLLTALTVLTQEENNAVTTTTNAATTTTGTPNVVSWPPHRRRMGYPHIGAKGKNWDTLTDQEKELQTRIATWHRTEFEFILWENDRDKILAKFGSSKAWDKLPLDVQKEELLEFRYRAIYNSFLLTPLEWLRNTPSVQSASFSILYGQELSDETRSAIDRMAGSTSWFLPTVSFVQPAMDELHSIAGRKLVEALGSPGSANDVRNEFARRVDMNHFSCIVFELHKPRRDSSTVLAVHCGLPYPKALYRRMWSKALTLSSVEQVCVFHTAIE